MTYDEAVEYLEFNVTQAYVGECTPAFINVMGYWDNKSNEKLRTGKKNLEAR